ncbi:MAG: hypothetical protein DI535_11795 [Citrobacter freundii]|nr:MAG: hypothetical protein DI535_11795 [Citrobacter freundii]
MSQIITSIVQTYRQLNSSTWTEWVFRLFFTWSFIHTGVVMPGEHYPDTNWLLILISIWCYFMRWRVIAFIPLFFCEFIHSVHVSH